mgnify:CR=1 FL=1
MKKLMSLLLVLALSFGCVAAMAETEAPANAAFEGTWVQFEDGFEVYLPSDWLVLEVTQDMIDSGIFYAVSSPDGARSMQVAWAESVDAATAEDVKVQLEGSYEGVEILNFNGVDFVSYSDSVNDCTGIAALDPNGGMFMFNFFPASDEAFGPVAVTIATSIRNTAA